MLSDTSGVAVIVVAVVSAAGGAAILAAAAALEVLVRGAGGGRDGVTEPIEGSVGLSGAKVIVKGRPAFLKRSSTV